MSSGVGNTQTVSLPAMNLERIVIDLVGFLYSEDLVRPNDKLARASESQRTLLHLSAALGFHDLLRELITRGLVLDRRDIGGRTALHYATLYGHLRCAKFLIDGGADVQVRDEHGRLPQDLVDFDHHDMENILKIRQSSSTNVRIVDSQGRQAQALPVSCALRPDVDEPATVISPRDYVSRALSGTSSLPSDVMTGEARLLISVDVGTSQTAVAVFYCKPGKVEPVIMSWRRINALTSGAHPIVTSIARWPGQEDVLYEEKVPSVLIYNCDGKVSNLIELRATSLIVHEACCMWRRSSFPRQGTRGRRYVVVMCRELQDASLSCRDSAEKQSSAERYSFTSYFASLT